jgi:hypothetical protein
MRRRKSLFRWVSVWLLFSMLGVEGSAPLAVNAAPQQVPQGAVIISEIAWGGTIASDHDEWIELHNTGSAISIDKWRLTSESIPFAKTPNVDITITHTGNFSAGAYYLLERDIDSVVDNITADQIYSGPGNLLDDGGETLYLYAPNGSGGYDLIDSANIDGGPWPAGIPAGYGSMERYDDKYYPDSDSVWITNTNPDPAGSVDFRGNPIHGTPKSQNWASTITPVSITTIISDTPDPSIPSIPVTVTVSVMGGPTTAIGKVNISGADKNCSITLDASSNGVGSCNVNFATIGTKTLTASYVPTSHHTPSIATHQHEVVNGITTTTTITDISPNPGVVDENVNVVVKVEQDSGSVQPTGTVSITGADTNCTITLANGTGNCNVRFASIGSKTLTATYNGQNAFILSKDTETVDIFQPSTTTITSDNPDPSRTNQPVNVAVTVSGDANVPTGTVEITGANSNCTITLDTNGKGNCNVSFSVSGTKTIKATYNGDDFYGPSSDTEIHGVSFVANTPVPPVVPSPVIGISEFLPRPGHDWNNDGVVNVLDEFIEIINAGRIDVNLSAYRLDDEANLGSSPYTLPNITLKPGERAVFYGAETGILLNDSGDTVRLLKGSTTVIDAYTYGVVAYPDQSWCRLPDRMGYWNHPCFPTPNNPNALTGTAPLPPGGPTAYQPPLCLFPDNTPEEFVYAECEAGGAGIWNRQYWDEADGTIQLKLDEPSKWETFFK